MAHEVFPLAQLFIHRLWAGEKFFPAIMGTLMNEYLLRRTSVFVSYHERRLEGTNSGDNAFFAEEVPRYLRCLYLFIVIPTWHFNPLGQRFRCPTPSCQKELVEVQGMCRKMNAGCPTWVFRCQLCRRQTAGAVNFPPEHKFTNAKMTDVGSGPGWCNGVGGGGGGVGIPHCCLVMSNITFRHHDAHYSLPYIILPPDTNAIRHDAASYSSSNIVVQCWRSFECPERADACAEYEEKPSPLIVVAAPSQPY